MAELATLARPYAEALFQVASARGDAAHTGAELGALATVSTDAGLRQFVDNPKTHFDQVRDVINAAMQQPLSGAVGNLLETVLENGRLAVLPEIAAQYRALVNERSGIADAVVYSAFPIDGAVLGEVVAALEKRFGRKLAATVRVDPELIGGVRVVVGDEVLDTSVKARLAQMKAVLTA